MKRSFYFYEKTKQSEVSCEKEISVFVDEKKLSPLFCKMVVIVGLCLVCLIVIVLYAK